MSRGFGAGRSERASPSDRSVGNDCPNTTSTAHFSSIPCYTRFRQLNTTIGKISRANVRNRVGTAVIWHCVSRPCIADSSVKETRFRRVCVRLIFTPSLSKCAPRQTFAFFVISAYSIRKFSPDHATLEQIRRLFRSCLRDRQYYPCIDFITPSHL